MLIQISATLWLSGLLYFLVDWTELQNEEQYRQKLRDEQEMRENQLIVWDDEKQREFRQKYINQRQVSGKCRSNKILVQHQKHSLKVSSKNIIFSNYITYDY